MSFNIEFQHELEELGLVLQVEATYSNGGGGGDEPTYGPECQDITAFIIWEDGDGEDVWDGLGDLYVAVLRRHLVWRTGEQGQKYPWNAVTCKPHLEIRDSIILLPPRPLHTLRAWEKDSFSNEYVRELVTLQSIIQERADEKASEADREGAGGPDPDEAHDRLQDDGK